MLEFEKVRRTNKQTDGRTDEQTDLCSELRYAQLINSYRLVGKRQITQGSVELEGQQGKGGLSVPIK